jgi:hypothetical protein
VIGSEAAVVVGAGGGRDGAAARQARDEPARQAVAVAREHGIGAVGEGADSGRSSSAPPAGRPTAARQARIAATPDSTRPFASTACIAVISASRGAGPAAKPRGEQSTRFSRPAASRARIAPISATQSGQVAS